MEQAKTFADLSSHIVKEIELKREGEWGKRLLAERVQIGKVMEGFMERAPREFRGRPADAQGPAGADFSQPPGAEKHEMALRYARLVAGSRHFAAAASFAAKQKDAYDELCHIAEALQRRRGQGAESAIRRTAWSNAQFLLCAELTAILFSEEEAELLRRRGRAALVPLRRLTRSISTNLKRLSESPFLNAA